MPKILSYPSPRGRCPGMTSWPSQATLRLFMHSGLQSVTLAFAAKMDVANAAKGYRRLWRDFRVAIVYPIGFLFTFATALLLESAGQVKGLSEPYSANFMLTLTELILTIFAMTTVTMIGKYECGKIIVGLVTSILSSVVFGGIFLLAASRLDAYGLVNLAGVAITLVATADGARTAVRLNAWRVNTKEKGLSALRRFRDMASRRRKSFRTFRLRRLVWILPGIACIGFTYILVVFVNNLGLLLLGMPPTLLRDFHDAERYSEEHPVTFVLFGAWQLVALGLLVAASFLLLRFFWRRVRRPATDIMTDASYAPIVFLRSFSDEMAKVKSRRILNSAIRRSERLEEILVSTVTAFGPTVAIGRPSERIPPLGAMRAYYSDDEWQPAIIDWINRAYLIVVMAGRSTMSLWELNYVLRGALVRKLVLVMPPDRDTATRQRRWAEICRIAEDTQWQQAVKSVRPDQLLALIFLQDGKLLQIDGDQSYQVDFELATRLLIGALFDAYPELT
jgi:hypothetical protein